MANTMRVLKKIEAPRPLKTTTTSQLLAIKLPQDSNQVTADSLISIAESIASVLLNKTSDVGLQNNLNWLSLQLKIHGPRIEVNYRDSLNKIFVIFRNASQDEDTNYNIRLSLLQLIELRANNWQASDGANSYYKTKTSHMHESIPMELVLSPSPEPFANASPTQLLLGPGEIVRASGKYTRPTRIPGKNYSKDEVVIRNADSGKVMGIKGRRVHMIEELSETIISFQRVNPGAKERLVQITGPTEDKINHAKQLIEDTIRRNASPVRSMEQFGMLSIGDCDRDSLDSLGFSTMDESVPRSLHHSRSVNDALVEEYIYTVTAGKHLIKITGDNLRYVQAAKLELDKLFSSKNLDNLDEIQSSSSDERNRNSISALSDTDDIAVGFGNGFNSTKDSSTLETSEDISLKPATERRKYFHRKSIEIKEYPDPVFDSHYRYSKDSLLMHSQSPFSSMIPRDMDRINKNNITKLKQVNILEAVKKWRAASTNNNNSQMDNNNYIRQNFSTTSTRTTKITKINDNHHHHACCGNANNNFIKNLNGNVNTFY